MPAWHWRTELDTVSPELAWKLLDPLFGQVGAMAIGMVVFIAVTLLGFSIHGERWYLAAALAGAFILAWRLWQSRRYRLRRDRLSPRAWLWRCMLGAWPSAACWGAMSVTILLEPNRDFALTVVGAQAASMIGSAVRNCSIQLVARGQITLILVPLIAACLIADSVYLRMFAGLVGVHLYVALTLSRYLNDQTLRMLRQDAEKSDLVSRLEIANKELEIINTHLKTLVATDPLTGLANRRAFDLALAQEAHRCSRETIPLSLLLIDVDRFKAYNDRYGHQAGDKCLRQVAEAITSAVQTPGAVIARYGGEEMAVILPNTYLGAAAGVAEVIMVALEVKNLAHLASEHRRVTLSIGAACLLPEEKEDPATLTAKADAALYAAKRSGRARVRTAQENRPIALSA